MKEASARMLLFYIAMFIDQIHVEFQCQHNEHLRIETWYLGQYVQVLTGGKQWWYPHV